MTPHDELSEALLYGRMTPNEAEAKLKDLGLPPLAPQPDPADYSPMREVSWTLPMTVAWIAWRTSADVREAWDKFRSEGSLWMHEPWRLGFEGPVNEGWHRRPRPPASISILRLSEIYRRRHATLPEGASTIDEALDLLWKAAEAGALVGTGKPNAFEPPMKIPEHGWRDLAPVEERDRDVLRYRERYGFSNRGYESIAFLRADVMAIWQPYRTWEKITELPPTMSPFEPGCMPLFCAAQWIATRGGIHDFQPTYRNMWQAAYSELLARVASNQVAVTGLRDGIREKLEGYLFASIAIDYPFSDASIELVFKDELRLQSYAYTDEESWRNGLDDSLRGRRGVQWSQLMVLKSEIARWWPFGEGATPEARPRGAGRPSNMPLIFAEFVRRTNCGELDDRIGKIAASLEAWMRTTHSALPTPTADTIANALRTKGYWPTK